MAGQAGVSKIEISPEMIDAGAAVLNDFLESRDDMETMPSATQLRRLTTDVAIAMIEHVDQSSRKKASRDA